MIEAKNENGKYSVPIKLIGDNKIITEYFYLDTGFDGYLKISKEKFDELGLLKIDKKEVSFANGSTETADIARVKYQIDQTVGDTEVKAVFGGKNLVGIRFMQSANMILIIDKVYGMCLSRNRDLAKEVGDIILKFYQKWKEE